MSSKLFFLAFLTKLVTCTFAQVVCNGNLASPNPITSDVIVSGGSCNIQGITITGSVLVSGNGVLTTVGSTAIQGNLIATGSGAITLGGSTTVSGGVSFADTSSTLTVEPNVIVNTISLSNGAVFLGKGTSGAISASNAGDITIQDATVTGGGISMNGGSGSLTLCGADVTGGIGFAGVTGDLISVTGPGCAVSTISGSINVADDAGKVQIIGSTLQNADLLVARRTGEVTVKNAKLSDVNIDQVTGTVLLENVETDSDSSVTATTGSVTLVDSDIKGDFRLTGTQGAVSVVDNDFKFEDFSVTGSTGQVTVTGNINFTANLIENAGVEFSNNNGQGAEISKNTVGTTINNNVLTTLSCSDNTPAPLGSGNSVGSATGQCTGF